MLELGTYSATAHRNIGAMMAVLGVDVLIAVGQEMRAASEEFRQGGREAHDVADAASARDVLLGICSEGDTVLIKGSRGMKMENVLGGNAAPAGERR
jgi:UDP-N-acetylmuramyl pentapeptide synthase